MAVQVRVMDVLLAGAAPAVWGSTYLVTQTWLPPGRPLLSATVRALPAGLVLLAWGRTLPTGRWWWRATVLGVLNIGAFFALLFVAAYRLPGGVAAVVGAVQPIVMLGVAKLVLGERSRWTHLVAAAGGLCGVGLLVLRAEAALDPVGVAAMVLATVLMSLGVALTKRWGRPERVGLLVFTGWQLTAGGLFLLPVALLVEGLPGRLTPANLLGYGYLAVIGTMVAYALWFRGIERLPATTMPFLGLLTPLVATALGWLVLGQGLNLAQGIGALIVGGSIMLVQFSPSRRQAPLVLRQTSGPVTATGECA